ncbi:MAG: DNA-directed RNA polymerase subunit beta' [Eubacteriales bacterium]|nr:DNA-directed RNA polymerase subunit beta' [Eubacteriales bacterium]
MLEESKKDVSNKSMKFDKIQIKLASPEDILEWSHGEVTKPETINYRTLKPEKDGLFCERIFGPSKDWECHCGKYKKIKDKGIICDKCGVEVTKASVRRDRMGHIHLAAPVSHIWYFKGIPSRMDLILDIGPKNLEKVLYFAAYIVLDPGTTDIAFKKILTEQEYRELYDQYPGQFRVGMGAEAILELLKNVDLVTEVAKLKEELANTTSQKAARLIKRIEVMDAFIAAGTKPEWMILTEVPVIPPDLRPMVQLDGGRFATSDLNDLYRRIINRNNRLARLKELGAPEIIVRNEKRMLQEAVDALIDNGRRNGRPVTGPGNRALKSLSDLLKGKQGRFRQNLLGKRVDYSGRSVIVVGPELKIYQCGLPKEMAIELFKPFVMRELVRRGLADNIKKAKKSVEHLENNVWDVLEDVIKEHPVMLNRAPTLHRLGIQAFEPILVEGKAIKLHPLVCTAFNADFDGDQMAVHLPLSVEAQAECRFMLLSPNNLLKPSDGGPVAVPSQDMVLGIYYLTQERPGAKGEGKFFKNVNEALLAYENGVITLHSKIMVRMSKKNAAGEIVSGETESTLGRFIFNEILPQDLGYVDRTIEENFLVPEVDFHVGKKQLKDILQHVINTHGTTTTAEVLDDIKAMGYKYSTRAAMTVSISEMTVPAIKKQLIADAEKMVEQITVNYNRGRSTDEERHKNVIRVWQDTDETLKNALIEGLDKYNNIFMMADSGARGSNQQIKQLAGMRGLMADTSGNTSELPIKSNFREGLDVLEYFISAHGARKGLSDTALRTADSGYLTRRLVDVSQDLIIRETDCSAGKTIPGMYVYSFVNDRATASSNAKEDILEPLQERITGRYLAEDIKDPATGEIIVASNHLVTPKRAEAIIKTGVDRVKIRTILTCRSHIGVCAKCYGSNMATGQTVQVGEAVGIIAAQSIGEPGTQLTMRTFHTGGVAGDNITQGLPRVEELFEARKPKTLAVLAEFGGTVSFAKTEKKTDIVITDDEGNSKAYPVSRDTRVKVEEGQIVAKGEEITEGSENPHDIVRILGVRAVQDYMIREVQKVYRIQGVEINDKHIELIVRQMLKKIIVDDAGDSEFLAGSQVDTIDFTEVNEKLEEEGKRPATGTPIILGITKASLASTSFMSAASFQETTKVLTDAAIYGKVDPLIGLKENVIIGKLIPAGTGMKRYAGVELDTANNFDEAAYDEAARAKEAAENAADEEVLNISEETAEEMTEEVTE